MTSERRRLAALMLLLFLLVPGAAPAASGQALEQLVPDLYEVRADGQRSLVVVGRDGIALVDPLNVEVARWLKEELPKRFPGRQVKYVIYSGVDYDRVAGAWVFDGVAEVIARNTFVERAVTARRTLPPRVAALDTNNNGSIERSEIQSPVLASILDRLDVKKTGALSPSQIWGDVLSPESEFTSRRSVDLGGTALELVYPGPAWGTDQALVYLPAHRLVFAAKHAPMASPLSDRTARATAVAQWTATVAALDFDTLLNGSGESTPRADVVAANRYVRTLLDGVNREADRGHSIAEIQSGTVIERFAGTPFAQQRDADIAAVFQRRTGLTFDVFAGGLVNYSPAAFEESIFSSCGVDYVCEVGRTSGVGFIAGAGTSVGKIRIRTELSTGMQRSVTLNAPRFFFRTADNYRDTHVSILGGVMTGQPGAFNVTWLGGFVFIIRKQSGGTFSSGNFVSSDTYASSRTAPALSFGADLSVPLTSGLALVVPARFTTRPDDLNDGVSTGLDVRVGAAVSLTLFRKPL